MLLISNLPQLVCLSSILFLTLPRKAAVILSVLGLLFVSFNLWGLLVYCYLLGVVVYKGWQIYQKQIPIPSIMMIAVVIVLTQILSTIMAFFQSPGAFPLLVSLLIVLLYPKVATYFRTHPVSLPTLMNKRMLASLLAFAISFQLVDIATPESLFEEEDSSVLLVWLLSIAGFLAYGLALNRIPALV